MADYVKIRVGSTYLPAPTEIKIGHELLWSSSTGRNTTTGEMIGAIVARKRTLSVKWEWLTATECNQILNELPNGSDDNGFKNVAVVTKIGNNTSEQDLNKCYRSTLNREIAGIIGGKLYYSLVTVDIVQK